MKFAFLSAGFVTVFQFCAVGNDWPNWLGPNYNGVIEDPGKKFSQDKKLSFFGQKQLG